MWRRIGLVSVAAGLSFLACRASAPEPDAAPPSGLTYTILADPRESGRSDPPTVYIDGLPRSELTIQYALEIDATTEDHRVELRTGDTVLAAVALSGRAFEDCVYQRPQDRVLKFQELVCEYDSGDLRLGTPSGLVRSPDGSVGQCIIDGSASCNPECYEWTCGSGTHCTSIVTSQVPRYSHLGCAPVGTGSAGDPCTFTAGSAGAYDDCGSGSVCVAGTCRALCTDACATCAPIDGVPAQLTFCSP